MMKSNTALKQFAYEYGVKIEHYHKKMRSSEKSLRKIIGIKWIQDWQRILGWNKSW